MSKTRLLYTLLVILLFLRVKEVCEGDYLSCQEMGDSSTVSKYNLEQTDSKLESFRARMTQLARRALPSPHSELLLGMSLGIDRLYEVPVFKKMLRDTGTIHVVVVSGYNVTLVYNFIIRLLGAPYKKRNLSLAITGTLLFALLSGFEPPVVRAWLMGSMIAFGKSYGRLLNALHVLLVTGLLLAIINPGYLYSLSFQLSFLATLSLIMFERSISAWLKLRLRLQNIFTDDLAATLSAQILIWPYLSYRFEQISLISPLVNALVLWTVPLATMSGSAWLAVSSLSKTLGSLTAPLVYLPLDFFVQGVEYFSRFKVFVIPVRVSLGFLVVYYLFCASFFLKYREGK